MKLILFITILLGIAIAIFSMDSGSMEQPGALTKPATDNSNAVLERGLSNN